MFRSTAELRANTLAPDPYEEKHTVAWLREQEKLWEKRLGATFAICLPPEQEASTQSELLGTVGIKLKSRDAGRAELGYWLDKCYWNLGYVTEAAQAVIDYGFKTLELHRIEAGHFPHNPSSGRVLQKLGMSFEGCRRDAVKKQGAYLSYVGYSILRPEWEMARRR